MPAMALPCQNCANCSTASPASALTCVMSATEHSLVSLAQGACDLSGVHLPRGKLRTQGIQACKEWLDPRQDRVDQLCHARDGIDGQAGQSAENRDLEGHRRRRRRASSIATMIPARACCSISFSRCMASTRRGSTARSRSSSPMPPSLPMSQAAWPMSAFGVEAAARQFGLDLVRLLTEDYFFVCRLAFLETEPMQRVLDIMKGREFQKAVAALPGYGGNRYRAWSTPSRNSSTESILSPDRDFQSAASGLDATSPDAIYSCDLNEEVARWKPDHSC